jgi:hypothetical protein
MAQLFDVNLTLIENSLCKERLEPVGYLPWLEESYRNPEPFWLGLKRAQDSLFPLPGKSTVFERYDFYHDIVIRNQRNGAPAFRWYDSVLGWQEIFYSELGTLANRKAAAWGRSGVQPGQKLCIVCPLGVNYVVCLMAALKMGLIISCLPPQGRTFLQNRLEVLAPDHIFTDEMYVSLLPAWRDQMLLETESAGTRNTDPERSYSYPSGSVVGLCFDPSSQATQVPRELISDSAYLWPMRDGLIALGMRPGHGVAAPGFHFLETQPVLLLACLLNGGTYLNLELDDIVADPQLLNVYPTKVMGVSRELRNILMENSVTLTTPWYYWFRNPAEALDIDLWQSFIETLGLQKVYSGNVKIDAARGGCSLFSARRQGQANVQVLPAAGVQWALGDPAGGDSEAVTDFGLFSPVSLGSGNGEKTATASLVAKSRREWLFVGSGVSGRAGRTYPQAEVLAVIQNLPYCSLSSIVEVPSLEAGSDSAFVLLVFVGGNTAVGEEGIITEILQAIEREMGKEFIPDRIQFFPLYPRGVADGKLDHDWCQRQYLSGGLFRKSREEIYRTLTQLREFVV